MDFVSQLQIKYAWLSQDNNLCNAIVNRAKMFYFALRYPCEPLADEETHPLTSFFEQQWILSACEELVERLGFNSATGYSENGVRWSFDNAQLSSRLVDLVKPIAVVL